MRPVIRTAAAALAAALSACACSGSSCVDAGGGAGAGPVTSSAPATTSSSPATITSLYDAGSGGSGTGGCSPEPLPSVVPEGWVEYTDWSCDCRFYVPGSPEHMPAPIEWEPCPSSPGGIDCRMMVTDWQTSTSPTAWPVDFFPKLSSLPGGTPIVGFRRLAWYEHIVDVVAELDGPVHMAVMQAGPTLWESDPGCLLNFHDFNEGKYVLRARGVSWDGRSSLSPDQGAIGGSIDDPRPTLLAHYQIPDWGVSWDVSSRWVVRVNANDFKVWASPWSMAEDILVTSPGTDPEGLHEAQLLVRGEAVFWSTGTLKRSGINVWDPVHGARPFIRWVGDYTKGAGDFGTDGIDMAWTYGEKEPNDESYDPCAVMTAPFTTEPAAVEPRRLRSSPDDAMGGDHTWRVGCGYATHYGSSSKVFLVRLSDGVAWSVPSAAPELDWSSPIGVTCEDLLILGKNNDRATFFRIRLDSLGEGMAPD